MAVLPSDERAPKTMPCMPGVIRIRTASVVQKRNWDLGLKNHDPKSPPPGDLQKARSAESVAGEPEPVHE
jgi:hypothetical protein